MNRTKAIIVLCLHFIFIFSLENSAADNSYTNGELVCSPTNFSCGIFLESQAETYQLYATHSINNGLPRRLKPQFMEVITVDKSTLYGSKKTIKDIELKTKSYIEKNENKINKHQQVCYTIKYSNNDGTETRCGKIVKCNQSHCIIRETHIYSLVKDTDGEQTFITDEMPYEYWLEKEIDRNDITTSGATVEDLILWDNINNVFIKLLL